MKVIKYKYIGNSKYLITLDEKEIILYEDVILKYEILIKKDISIEDFKKIEDDNNFYLLYYQAIKFIKIKLRTANEVKKYLLKYTTDKEQIDEIVKKLEKNKIIDNDLYACAYINDAINLKNIGPNKISKDLLDLGVTKNVIDKYLLKFTDSIIDEKISKIISKELKVNKRSNYEFKNKMIIKLTSKGYSKEVIKRNLENIKIEDSKAKEIEYNKLYKRLSLKYSGKELEFKINQKLYQKGF